MQTRMGCVTGERYFSTVGRARHATLAYQAQRGYLAKKAEQAGLKVPPLDSVTEESPVRAYIHSDRWVVSCPDCGNDTQFVFETTLLYLCVYCWNVGVDGKWRQVLLPPNKEFLETNLGLRPFPKQRNWLPGESDKRVEADTRDLVLTFSERKRHASNPA